MKELIGLCAELLTAISITLHALHYGIRKWRSTVEEGSMGCLDVTDLGDTEDHSTGEDSADASEAQSMHLD